MQIWTSPIQCTGKSPLSSPKPYRPLTCCSLTANRIQASSRKLNLYVLYSFRYARNTWVHKTQHNTYSYYWLLLCPLCSLPYQIRKWKFFFSSCKSQHRVLWPLLITMTTGISACKLPADPSPGRKGNLLAGNPSSRLESANMQSHLLERDKVC